MNFNSPQFNTVVEGALVLAAGNPRWEKAIQRAASGLKKGKIVVSELASGALVTSENGSYDVTFNECQCYAFRHGHAECKHRAARRLCQLYSLAEISNKAEEKRIESDVETAIEYDRTGVSYKVTRCNGWPI